MSNECNCDKCAKACTVKPGWFTPDQIKPLAKALKLSQVELFRRHLQIDWWNDSPDVFVLSPKLVGEKGGTMFPGEPSGTCHWFKDGKCAIHSLGKPAECAFYHHTTERASTLENHEKTADAWRTPEHQELIRTLYGAEPESEPYFGHGGLFGSLFGSIFGSGFAAED